MLAHQGGWDEMLLVAGPIAVFVVLLWVANKRAASEVREAESRETGEDD